MAPLCSDPRQIVITLDVPRRKALLRLVDEITSYMMSELEIPVEELGSVGTDNDFKETDGSSERSGTSTPQDMTAKTQQPQKQTGKAARQAEKIQKAAVKHMSEWKKAFLPKLEEIVRVEDKPEVVAERKSRLAAMNKKKLDTPEEGEDLISFGEVKINKSEDIAATNMLYHAIPTRLSAIPYEDRQETICCVLLLLLSTGKYSAHSRALILYLASALELSQNFVNHQEAEIAKSLLESSKDDKNKDEAMSAEAEAAKRQQENKFSRFWKVGLASVAGAAVIGVTGGLAAPLVAGALGGVLGGVGLGGVASFLGIFWMNGALVGALFGAYGAKMTGEMMDNYAKEVEDFRFIPLAEEWGKESRDNSSPDVGQRRLRVTIGINGWLYSEDDVTKPWRVMNSETEVFALRYELKTLLTLGTALKDMATSFAWKALKVEIIKRTVLATLMAALWPIQVIAAASNLDNPFSRANNRSRKAGQLLADAIINRVPGERPVTLIGYSLGATVIHACLQSLAERHAFGLVDTVVVIGAPAPSAAAHWRTIRTVVSGKIFNVYSENDMVLGLVYRMHSLAMGVAGMQPIEGVEGIENLDLSGTVSGHLRYADLTGEILRRCGFLGVKAGMEIEKDDVIKMKDDHAEGKLVDVEGALKDSEDNKKSSMTDKMADDLRGLDMSPPIGQAPTSPPPPTKGLLQENGSQNPPLPKRPTVDTAATAAATATTMLAFSAEPSRHIDNAPRKSSFDDEPQLVKPSNGTVKAEPLTPTTNDSDDGEYRAITMEDNDD